MHITVTGAHQGACHGIEATGCRENISEFTFCHLEHGKVAEVWDHMYYGDTAFPVLRDELRRRYPDVEVIDYTNFGNIHGPDENDVVAHLPEELRRRHVDAVVLGIGN